jgi:hypothetical protein
MRPSLLFAAVALTACAHGPSAQTHAEPVASTAPSTGAPHFIEDDYAQALAQARAQNKPLFIEAWAPW